MFGLILKAKGRAIARELSGDWPTYFLLGPLMIGVVLLLGRRIFDDFAVNVGRIKPVDFSEETILRLAFVFLFLKVFFNFLPMARRLYPTDQTLRVDDLLPIDFRIRYQVFYLEQLLRDLPFFIFGTFLVLFFGKMNLIGWPFLVWCFFPGVEIGFTLGWIHFRSPDRKELAGAFGVLLFLLWIVPIAQFGWWADAFTFIFVPLGYYRGFKIWRYRDGGRVEQFLMQRQQHKNSGAAYDVFRKISRMTPKAVQVLFQRDLILTARNFVPHIWRNLVLSSMVALGVTNRGSFAPEPICAAAVFIMASTVAPLFSLQRPYREMDRVLPLSAGQVWRGKLTYARFLSMPFPWVVWGLEIAARPLPMNEAVVLLFELLLVGFAVSSLVGGSICEGDQRPVLQYIIAAMMSALATLFISVFNPLLFLLLFPILSSLKGSAITRLEGEGVVS
ncbi:MAG: hypothetical protein ACE5GK_08155 [Nitrospiria bacterium]